VSLPQFVHWLVLKVQVTGAQDNVPLAKPCV
jgi:hypothetical protein